MSLPNFIQSEALKTFAPTLAKDLSAAVVTASLAGEQGVQELLTAARVMGGKYDAQTFATASYEWLQGIIAAYCDQSGESAETKAVIMAALAANAPVIQIEKAEDV